MARYVTAIVVIFFGLSGPSHEAPPLSVDLGLSAWGSGVMADADPPYTPPSLTAELRYQAPQSALGWGSVDLSAHPEDHEIRVSVMLGAPVAGARWEHCKELHMRVDGEETKHPTRYSGVPMDGGGVYDAVSVELTIDDVRRMSRGRDVHLGLCGDVLSLPAAERASLSSFVRRFEEMATYDGPPPPKPPRELDGEPEGAEDEPAPPIAA